MEMGAGGGSISRVDERGLLRVGPESAGAAPGPACYSLGGFDATVTDADLILGYLNPEHFLGGQMRLDKSKACDAVMEEIAKPLDLSLSEAAYGIFKVVNQNMSQAFRVHAAERGVDVRNFVLFAFGGAGPVHAWRVAENLYVSKVLVPFEAGIASAMGLIVTPLAFDLARTRRSNLHELTIEQYSTIYDQMIDEKLIILEEAGLPAQDIGISKALDMRYRGQGFNIEVELPKDFRFNYERLKDLFEERYKQLYSLTVEGVPIEVYNFKALVSGPEFEVKLNNRPEVVSGDPLKGCRRAYFGEESGFLVCDVYDRYRLRPGSSVTGPSIVEEVTSTCVVPPRAKATVDEFYNLVIDLG
jgi:N-methylhydantoinase A